MVRKLGTVISLADSPNTTRFAFVINDDAVNAVKKGQFIKLEHENGTLIAVVKDIFRSNRYFERAESVAEYERIGMLSSQFPVSDWSYTIAEAGIIGVFDGSMLHRCSFPPSPGNDVRSVEDEMLSKYLGFKQDGLNIGTLLNHNTNVKLGLSKLFQKHVAILAMSGAGKSYLMSVLLEELLSRKKEHGRVGVVVIDVHGEYAHMKNSIYSKNVVVHDASKIKIGLKNLSADMFPFYNSLSGPQKRILNTELRSLKKSARTERKLFTLRDLINCILSESDKKTAQSRDTLAEHLNSMQRMRLLGKVDDPSITSLVQPGKVSIIDMKNVDSIKKKQLLVAYYSRRLFRAVKKKRIPPFILVIEEAHNFAGEKVKKEDMLSKYEIELIAREGRKFGASICLISQRPVKLSTTALSQCNTHVIMRVTNPYDIKHIGESSEGIDKYMLDSITSLKTGEALLVGEAVVQPVFVKVRKRNADFAFESPNLESLARDYEKELEQKKEDVEAFL